MLCRAWDEKSMTNEQFISNLFEMKESLGVKHVKEIVVMISNAIFCVSGNKPCKMLGEVFEFIRPEEKEIEL